MKNSFITSGLALMSDTYTPFLHTLKIHHCNYLGLNFSNCSMLADCDYNICRCYEGLSPNREFICKQQAISNPSLPLQEIKLVLEILTAK